MLKNAAEAFDGWFKITSEEGKGTRVTVQFQLSHIDRMPLGDLADTFLTLQLGALEVNWIFTVKRDEHQFHFDDSELKKELEGIELTEPEVIRFIRSIFKEGIQELQLL
jgi:hypothetical protein